MEAIQIRFECEQFKQKMLELNPNIMIDFSVFDPSEMAKDLEGRDEEYNEYSQTHTAYRDDDKK